MMYQNLQNFFYFSGFLSFSPFFFFFVVVVSDIAYCHDILAILRQACLSFQNK